MSKDEREKISTEGSLEERILEAIDNGNFDALDKLLEEVKDPKVLESILTKVDGLEKAPKNILKIRGLLSKKANGLITEIEVKGDDEAKKSLDSLKETLVKFDEKTIQIVREKIKSNGPRSVQPKKEKQEDEKESLSDLFIKAVENGDYKGAASILGKDKSVVNSRNKEGKSALAIAINSKNADMVNLLMDNKAEVNVSGANPDSFNGISSKLKPEHQEAISGIMDYVVKIKGQAVAKDGSGGFVQDLPFGEKKTQSKLLQSSAHRIQKLIDAQNEAKMLEAQAMEARKIVMEILDMEERHIIGVRTAFGNKIFSAASMDAGAIRGGEIKEEIASTQVVASEQVVNVSHQERDGATINHDKNTTEVVSVTSADLVRAIREGNLSMALALIAQGVDLNQGADGKSPLNLALESGNLFLSSILLARGANPNLSDIGGHTVDNIARSNELAKQNDHVLSDAVIKASYEKHKSKDQGLSDVDNKENHQGETIKRDNIGKNKDLKEGDQSQDKIPGTKDISGITASQIIDQKQEGRH